jgi:probable HAF family extracellular repeat protein
MLTYTYTTLDDPLGINGTNGTYAFGINDRGVVAGYYYDSSGDAHGFRYSGGSYITLDYPPGTSNQTFPEGINAKGQIVGWYNDGSSDHGFLYSGGSYTTLNDPLATVNTFATGINDKGQIVGYYQDGVSGGGLVNHGFIYVGGIYTAIDDPFAISPSVSGGTGIGTAALGINDKGQVVGYYYDSSRDAHGFLYSGGSYTTLDDPLGVNGTVATGINDKGQIVGYYSDNLNDRHGFLYSGGSYTTLDDLGVNGTVATGINDKGDIVGYYQDGHSHGFLAATAHAPPSGNMTAEGTQAQIHNTVTPPVSSDQQILGLVQALAAFGSAGALDQPSSTLIGTESSHPVLLTAPHQA